MCLVYLLEIVCKFGIDLVELASPVVAAPCRVNVRASVLVARLKRQNPMHSFSMSA